MEKKTVRSQLKLASILLDAAGIDDSQFTSVCVAGYSGELHFQLEPDGFAKAAKAFGIKKSDIQQTGRSACHYSDCTNVHLCFYHPETKWICLVPENQLDELLSLIASAPAADREVERLVSTAGV